MQKQCVILVVISVLLILLQYVSVPSISNHQEHPDLLRPTINDKLHNSINLGFSNFAYEQAKLEETKLRNEYDLTAVILHWQRLEGIQKTLQYLLGTHFFKEIIMWNNNPNINLTIHHLIDIDHTNVHIRIINSDKNLKDEAKYRACAEAKTRACFYVDDDWDVSHYFKSLIASFRSDPYLLHSVTEPYTFYTNLIWIYFDSAIDLHSGFSWIGCGSVFLRQHAQKHLQLMYKFLKNQTDLIHLSDVFFSVWLNDIPVQMNTNIRSQPSKTSGGTVPFSATPRFLDLQYRSSVLAIRILEHSLRYNATQTENNLTFSRQQNQRFPYYVKSPSLNDDSIFYTNILPLQFQNISFNISRDFERGTRNNLPQGPNVTYFTQHSTLNAVDGDLSTYWRANRQICSDDFFAIDLLSIQTNVIFTVTVTHNVGLQKSLEISMSFDGHFWLPYRSYNGIYTKTNGTVEQHQHTFLYDSSEFNPGFRSFRYLLFKATEHSHHHFQVCEIQLVSKNNISDIKRDYYQLNK